MLKDKLSKLRNITSHEDLTDEEWSAIIKSVDTFPCIPFTFKFLRQYADQIDVDFSKIKDEEQDRKYLLSPEMVRILMMRDYDALRGLCVVLNTKAIYRKAWEAFVIDKDQMDMTLDEFRARCQIEYEDCKLLEKKNEGDES